MKKRVKPSKSPRKTINSTPSKSNTKTEKRCVCYTSLQQERKRNKATTRQTISYLTCSLSRTFPLQVYGSHAIDVLQLGSSIRIEEQVFAQITSLRSFATCEAEEGILGLAYSMISSHGYPSLLSNLDNPNLLLHGVFSLYLNMADDYPPDPNDILSGQFFDEQGNVQYGSNRPTSYSSQIVFGGVDQKHYEGCLTWHDLVEYESAQDGTNPQGFWEIALDAVYVGGIDLAPATHADTQRGLVDSGSTYIVGPKLAVAQFAQYNHAKCFTLKDPEKPESTSCYPGNFDAAMVDCDQPFFDLEFVVDGTTYVLEREDLLYQVPTSKGEACVLKMIGSEDIPVRLNSICSKCGYVCVAGPISHDLRCLAMY